ncbi:MAG TPA: DUF692 family protein, partial [Pirellulales bacterium]|nr:DUF692 family protein [Pirellulales bacterium]
MSRVPARFVSPPLPAMTLAAQSLPARLGHPNLGLGVGLRSVHFQHILHEQPAVDWFEIISEN